MTEEPTRSRLGRGLAALIGDIGEPEAKPNRQNANKIVPTEFLRPSQKNPRRAFDNIELENLANSIREKGIIQPILVRAMPGIADVYEIVAGERRWRAAQRAGLHEVPILVIEATDREALELAIIENVQRADLNPIEESAGYERLIEEFSYSHTDLGKIIGKSRSHIANSLRLLKLPSSIKEKLISGEITSGHARALLSVADPETAARRIIEQGLTVRDIERMAQSDQAVLPKTAGRMRNRPEKDPDTLGLEKILEDLLGMTVLISHGDRGGEIKIKYRTIEQLEAVCRRLQS
ncbi:MAG: ParB/RepB/Spo0J family partition protein [Hyphomicrobiales bacterium]